LRPFTLSFFLFLSAGSGFVARAEMALFMEEPFATFGRLNPTGHAAIYLSHVCAATPVTLRRCGPDEPGVVISRYHLVGGYDWLAIPLLPYLYAVDRPEDIPARIDARTEELLRDRYRRDNLREIVPDSPTGKPPDGNWIELLGAAYDRRIYALEVDTTEEQDDRLIEQFNSARNRECFNLLFRNCAGFARRMVDFYYPHAAGRSSVLDLGLATPKKLAKSLIRYGRRHPDSGFRAYVIAQIPGLPRSKEIRGVLESLLSGPEYTLPVMAVHPLLLGGVAVAYVTRSFLPGRPHFPGNIGVSLDPAEIPQKLAFEDRSAQAGAD
jgi:hypothetical protein